MLGVRQSAWRSAFRLRLGCGSAAPRQAISALTYADWCSNTMGRSFEARTLGRPAAFCGARLRFGERLCVGSSSQCPDCDPARLDRPSRLDGRVAVAHGRRAERQVVSVLLGPSRFGHRRNGRVRSRQGDAQRQSPSVRKRATRPVRARRLGTERNEPRPNSRSTRSPGPHPPRRAMSSSGSPAAGRRRRRRSLSRATRHGASTGPTATAPSEAASTSTSTAATCPISTT